ncbi:MAG TPA: transporter substrate-binding domain-containing protein [Candidatus Babeliales bacterium]|jgi:polar amino acid transport system substrate-binding protein|nr:transporter substrate-binding domain-containing protein [Candidatus Babeliales bacterium]
MNKKITISSIIFITLIGLYYYYSKPASIHNHLHIGVASGYAPWAVITEAGLVGFDVDIAKELGKRLGVTITLVDMSPELLITSVKTKKLDLMVAPMAITAEREKAFYMVHYQGAKATHWPLMFLGKIPEHIKTLDDVGTLPNNIVSVLPGTKQTEYAYSISSVTVRTLDSIPLILMDVRQGKSIAALIDPDLGTRIQQENPDMSFVQIPVPQEYQSKGNGIAIHSDNHILAQRVTEVVSCMKKDGFIEQSEQTWNIRRLV